MAPEYRDCIDNCVFAQEFIEMKSEVKTKVGWRQFMWLVGGLCTALVLVISVSATSLFTISDNINNKMDRIQCEMVEMNSNIVKLNTTMQERRIYIDERIDKLDKYHD